MTEELSSPFINEERWRLRKVEKLAQRHSHEMMEPEFNPKSSNLALAFLASFSSSLSPSQFPQNCRPVSVSTTLFCYCSAKSAIDNT